MTGHPSAILKTVTFRTQACRRVERKAMRYQFLAVALFATCAIGCGNKSASPKATTPHIRLQPERLALKPGTVRVWFAKPLVTRNASGEIVFWITPANAETKIISVTPGFVDLRLNGDEDIQLAYSVPLKDPRLPSRIYQLYLRVDPQAATEPPTKIGPNKKPAYEVVALERNATTQPQTMTYFVELK